MSSDSVVSCSPDRMSPGNWSSSSSCITVVEKNLAHDYSTVGENVYEEIMNFASVDSYQFETPAPTPTRTSKERRRTLELFRLQTLSVLKSDVFFLETYMVEDFILELRLSSRNCSHTVTTRPWSMSTGRCVSEAEFRRKVRSPGAADTPEVKRILSRPNVDFTPQWFVLMVLLVSQGIPTIVSSSFTKMMGRRRGQGKRFLEHVVFREILVDAETCQSPGCERPISAVVVKGNSQPEAVYCSGHALTLGTKRLLLYNPLLVSVTAHRTNTVVSAMDIEEFFGQRYAIKPPSVELAPLGTASLPLPMMWTPILKMPHHNILESRSQMSMLKEAVMNYGHQPTEISALALVVTLTTTLLKEALDRCEGLCHLGIPTTEDLPYQWHPCDL